MANNEYPLTMTTFPRLGTPGVFTQPYFPATGDRSRSQFLPDEVINPHIRFPTLAANIRSRRGRKVQVNVPIFHDEKTEKPWQDPTVDYDRHLFPEDNDVREGAVKPDHIHMDAMGFGMGSCCLQITFQAKNIKEGRKLYDQLSPLGPIFLALTAATPIYKGFLADTDVRWNQISAAVDDRTAEELGEAPLKTSRWQIPKSRYASNSTYISEDIKLRKEYLDPDLVVNPEVKETLLKGGMDDLLATHFAHLFIRDPLVIFKEDLEKLDLDRTDHFENLQSTNWQHMRFKPPPHDESTGWRVEFRSMEIQATDFENAAFSIFLVLLTRAIVSYDLNFYIPITKVTENMETAHKRDAVLNEKFYFRKNPFAHRAARHSHHTGGIASGVSTPRESSRPQTPQLPPQIPVEEEYELMTIDEILNGQAPLSKTDLHQSPDQSIPFPGLIPLVENYLDSRNVDVETRCELATYIDLIRKRANGKLWTAARWIRQFVRTHPEYNGDSVVNEQVNWELCKVYEVLGKGEGRAQGVAKEMFGWK
jgi:glutamate--cysteine ligase catalytic subunit